MHLLLVETIVATCRQRESEGDYPTVSSFSVEVLEDCVIELAKQRDQAKETMQLIASGLKKFAPDLVEELTRRWKLANALGSS